MLDLFKYELFRNYFEDGMRLGSRLGYLFLIWYSRIRFSLGSSRVIMDDWELVDYLYCKEGILGILGLRWFEVCMLVSRCGIDGGWGRGIVEWLRKIYCNSVWNEWFLVMVVVVVVLMMFKWV